ncbi:MAG: hypothetical protein HC910_18885 [Spirulinaceae cyanobacterium SM2_1_0]|nr:hypothetical protein [Spirulinaceae cyanobacterium SM2_1_0]
MGQITQWNCVIPRQAWQQTLQAALKQCGLPLVADDRDRRVVRPAALGYQSAIARRLAGPTPSQAAMIAAQIAAAVSGSDFQVTVGDRDAADLLATWNPTAIAAWLRELTVTLTGNTSLPSVASASDPFVPVQYASARCTMLLQLAAQQRWLAGAVDPTTGLWQSADPPLDLTSATQGWQPVDWALCGQLLAIADAQLRPAADWRRLGLALGEALLTWQQQQPLASARRSQLGLLVATQRVFVWLLTVPGGLSPHFEL